MIITPQNTGMTHKTAKLPQGDDPPPYNVEDTVRPLLSPVVEEREPLSPHPSYGTVPPLTHRYVNPRTNEQIMSSLPPDHPQMVCLQNGHDTQTSFGIFGILAAIVWFPFGIGCCLLDRRTVCRRCGAVLSSGCCG